MTNLSVTWLHKLMTVVVPSVALGCRRAPPAGSLFSDRTDSLRSLTRLEMRCLLGTRSQRKSSSESFC